MGKGVKGEIMRKSMYFMVGMIVCLSIVVGLYIRYPLHNVNWLAVPNWNGLEYGFTFYYEGIRPVPLPNKGNYKNKKWKKLDSGRSTKWTWERYVQETPPQSLYLKGWQKADQQWKEYIKKVGGERQAFLNITTSMVQSGSTGFHVN